MLTNFDHFFLLKLENFALNKPKIKFMTNLDLQSQILTIFSSSNWKISTQETKNQIMTSKTKILTNFDNFFLLKLKDFYLNKPKIKIVTNFDNFFLLKLKDFYLNNPKIKIMTNFDLQNQKYGPILAIYASSNWKMLTQETKTQRF